jgi:hypothetical protein
MATKDNPGSQSIDVDDKKWLETKNHGYTDDQLHDFVERVAIAIYDGGLTETRARVLAHNRVFIGHI